MGGNRAVVVDGGGDVGVDSGGCGVGVVGVGIDVGGGGVGVVGCR